ncbi:MAG: response regulator [Nitrospirae bacterium]|nr:response regulator [Nitrospirota bacterium]
MELIDMVRRLKKVSKDITVLLVEDEEIPSKALLDILSKYFDNVTCAFNGREGLDKYKSGRHDIVITDMDMPVMNGIVMTRRIKEINNEQIVIVVSAYDDSRSLRDLINTNVSGFILKPVEAVNLLDALYTACKRIVNERQIEQWHKDIEDIVRQRTLQLYEANESLSASLKDNTVLLKEVHHRVRNNLQIISSLLSLQAEKIADQHLLGIFMDSQQRIRSMALIHEKLYQSADMSKLDFAQYVEELTAELLESYCSYNNNADIRLELDLDSSAKMLNIDMVVPCALVICELVSNSLKYAFSSGQEGCIWIIFDKNADGNFELIIGDNGIGLPKDFDIKKLNTLGMNLVCDLITRKLRGEFEIDSSNGTTFKILF